MAIGAFVPLALFVVVLGSVGLRLVLLWRRTRQVAEMSLGFGLLAVSLSLPLSAAGRMPALALHPVGRSCFAAGLGVSALGLCAMVFFNYRVFRHGSAWGRSLLALVCLLLVGSVGYISAVNFQGTSVADIKQSMRPGTLGIVVTLGLAFLWAAAESLGHYGASRRQRALGLADPVLTNRFLLWGLASVTSSALMGVISACVLAGMTIVHEPLPLATMAASGMVMSGTWYLTFFPPRSYRRFIRRRAAARA